MRGLGKIRIKENTTVNETNVYKIKNRFKVVLESNFFARNWIQKVPIRVGRPWVIPYSAGCPDRIVI